MSAIGTTLALATPLGLATPLALVFERPAALALLAVPLVLLLVSSRRSAARVVATGDLDVWRASTTPGTSARPRAPRRVPWAQMCALAALAAAALAIAAPRAGSAHTSWTCVLDTSASMSLADGTSTRRARAIAAVRELAREHGAELRWIAPAFGATPRAEPDEAAPADAPPAATDFAAWDVPGALWVTDATPTERPRFAGFVASGGVAVPGPIAVEGADRIDWDGARLVTRSGAAPERVVVLTGGALAEGAGPLARAVAAWASARGVRTSTNADEPAAAIALHVRAADGATLDELVAGRDGWTAPGARRAYVVDDALDSPWIASAGRTLVAARPGSVAIGWIPGEPSDGAAFAVSWARLLDACALPPPGIVALEERVAAGDPAHALPTEAARAGVHPTTAMLGALAALLALSALILRR